MGIFMGMPRKMAGFVFATIEVIGVLIAIGLGVLLLVAIEIGLRLRGAGAERRTGLLSELREEARLLTEGAKAE
jgi:hypothetical protein